MVMFLCNKRDNFPFKVQSYPHLGSLMHAYMYGVYLSQLFFVTLTLWLLDLCYPYGLLCRRFKQFYWSHHFLVQRYSHSVMQHLQEGVDSQVWWWRICILLVGAAVTGTDWLLIYPFTGVLLAFSIFFTVFLNFRFFCSFNFFFLFFFFFLFSFLIFFFT